MRSLVNVVLSILSPHLVSLFSLSIDGPRLGFDGTILMTMILFLGVTILDRIKELKK